MILRSFKYGYLYLNHDPRNPKLHAAVQRSTDIGRTFTGGSVAVFLFGWALFVGIHSSERMRWNNFTSKWELDAPPSDADATLVDDCIAADEFTTACAADSRTWRADGE